MTWRGKGCHMEKEKKILIFSSLFCHIGGMGRVYIGEGGRKMRAEAAPTTIPQPTAQFSNQKGSTMQDNQIIDLFFARDEEAIAVCQRQFGAACMRLARNLLHSEPDAEECVSDTWLRAWNAIPPKRPSPLRAYLLRITRNLSVNRLRYLHSKCRDRSLTLPLDELDACIPATEDNLSELGSLISEFLRTLSQEDRLLFMGRYFHAMPVEELAARMGLKPNTASVRLRRTREALRVYLSERGYSV